MNKRNGCTSINGWSTGTHHEHGTSAYIISVSRYYRDLPNDFGGKGLHVPGDLDGVVCSSWAEASRLQEEHGYLHPYCRNTCGFVMSRAARKHGMKTNDSRYLSRERRGK